MNNKIEKHYIKKFRASKENYIITPYECLHLDKEKRIGKVVNRISGGANKYLQGNKYVENLRFTIKEIKSQF